MRQMSTMSTTVAVGRFWVEVESDIRGDLSFKERLNLYKRERELLIYDGLVF